MTDYKPQERQDLEELYRKQNVRINELEQCNLNLQEWLDNKEKVNKSLREENKNLKAELSRWQQWKYRYFWNDGETDLYECMEEDTLQELKDIWEI